MHSFSPVILSCLRFLLYFFPPDSTTYDRGAMGLMQTAGDHSCSFGLFIRIAVPGSIGGRYLAFSLYCAACASLLHSILAATSALGTTSGSKSLLVIGSLVLVRLPNNRCAGEDCSFSVGVFRKSSSARYV